MTKEENKSKDIVGYLEGSAKWKKLYHDEMEENKKLKIEVEKYKTKWLEAGHIIDQLRDELDQLNN